MKAIVKDDMIVKVTIRKGIDAVEIGNLPKGIALADLRWDGEKIVRLDELEEFYVKNDTHELHIIPLKNTQLVRMKYSDRNHLINDNGILRVKTEEEKQEKKINAYKYRRRHHYPQLSDQIGAILKYLKQKNDVPYELKKIIDKVDDVKTKFPKKKINEKN